ncbi:MAG: hypothetical protein OEL83_13905 [Desulforhopalus sp.]|nr:hypothetical protein [Desulforhopalus sp.]
MRIADSAIQLYSKNTAFASYQKRESLTVWHNGGEPRVTGANGRRGRELDPDKEIHRLADKVSLSSPAAVKKREVQPAELEIPEEQEMMSDLNLRILQALFEKLTGRKFQTIDPLKVSGAVVENAPVVAGSEGTEAVAPPENSSAGYGLVYEYHESQYEYEKIEFAAAGVITTTDGRTIDFSASLSMSREFYSEQNINIRAGDALKDPLVVNFSGTAAQLTERNFAFDIDVDGSAEQIAFVSPGSGFLALDKNSDGMINDGSELFGTASGNGFADLSAYDADGNNWIDENDAIYESLRIWSRNSSGEEQLLALGQVGIGALYLGHIETAFSVKDAENALLGQVRETGLALLESGQAVTMQQIDLVA